MALLTKAVKGTQDMLPADTGRHRFLENTLLEIAGSFGFKEIRTPVFEHTELFQRGVGETTDVVQKEMYTFDDKGGRSITLRPEGTAGAVRAFLEHGLFNEALPQKLCYVLNCYRYEKPQAGRWREFQQFGVEMFGSASPAADAEVISLANEIFTFLGVKDIELQLNSIGCPECRKNYHAALKEYFEGFKGELCGTCLERLDKNPMRILDCKSPVCSKIASESPIITDYLCDECREHFEGVQKYLDAMGISYRINPRIVRGLDYYTKTAFEFVSNNIGAQGTVCGGGRYDNLCEELGGPPIPGIGFGLGIERLLMLMDANGVEIPEPEPVNAFIVTMGEDARAAGLKLLRELHKEGVSAQMDDLSRNVKGQFKYASRLKAKNTIVIGEDELARGVVQLKDMDKHEQREVSLKEIVEALK